MVYRKLPNPFCKYNTTKQAGRYIVNELPKTFNDAVYPRIPFNVRSKTWKLKNRVDSSPSGKLIGHSFTITDLFRDERLLLGYVRATVVRPYAERLIVEAMRHGDKHKPTMELANFWLREKNLIHKLFKVLVPRYKDYSTAFTAIHMLGEDHSAALLPHKQLGAGLAYNPIRGEAVLELRGNELPPIIRPKLDRSGLITNILLAGAREKRYGQSVLFNTNGSQED